MAKQVRIQSDGHASATVITAGDGTELQTVEAVVWLNAGEINRVDLTLYMPHLDIHADLQEVTFLCKCCQGTVVHHCNGDGP